MKKIALILLLLAIPSLLFAAEPIRKWKSKSGKPIIEAALDVNSSSDQETVYLLKDGKRYKVPLKNLSQADQNYVTNRRGIVVVPTRKRYALLIGVNEYVKPIRSLQYCVNDMKLLAECFQKAGMPKENIILVTDDSPFEFRPTGVNIRRQIGAIMNLMNEDDQLIVAFSGHGAMLRGKSYLCPSDADLNDNNSLISRDWVFEQLEMCKARQKAFIVDACRNDISNDGKKTVGQAQTLDDPIGADTHGFILIASCDKNQQSWEHPEIEHGVFTYFLAQGLSGAARNDQGYVTIMGLFRYASSKTKMFVYRKRNEIQVPTFCQGNEMTDFCLGKPTEDIEIKSDEIDDSEDLPPSFSLVESPSKPYKAGDRLVYEINGVEFAFRYCPPGTVPTISPGRRNSEFNGFWMMETEVTRKQWIAVIGSIPLSCLGKDDNIPAFPLLWKNCDAFCKMCATYGLPVQIPTQKQWEYACRAGTTGSYAGNLDEMAWYNLSKWSPRPVGKKKPNAWGLYDMHGNVPEVCYDCYKDSYPQDSPSDPDSPDLVKCGGSWKSSANECRSASRDILRLPEDQDPSTGLRLMLPVASPE